MKQTKVIVCLALYFSLSYITVEGKGYKDPYKTTKKTTTTTTRKTNKYDEGVTFVNKINLYWMTSKI